MQPTRHLIPTAIPTKLPTSVKHRQNRLQRRLARRWMHIRRDPPTIVPDRHHVRPQIHIHVHTRRKSTLYFVNAIVQNFIDEMMQPPLPGTPDVHPRPLPHRVEPLEHLDLRTVVGRRVFHKRRR